MVHNRNTPFLSNTVFEKKICDTQILEPPPPKKKPSKILTYLGIEQVSFLNKLLDVKRH